MTDLTKWRLETDNGRHTWVYSENPNRPQSFAEKYFIGLTTEKDTEDIKNKPASTNGEYLDKAIEFYSKLQLEDGHWGNDYGGPMFLLPGLVITCYITGVALSNPQKLEMIRYLLFTQREDGGWGLHIESPSTMFGSALTYVTLRILGLPHDHESILRAKEWIKLNGGAQSIPSWGKFWLAALGVYEWEGLNPIPPEFWLFPWWFPIHPGKWWCHCRMVYLPMGYIYGKKLSFPVNELTSALRNELYPNPSYDKIVWKNMRNCVCPADLYTPHTLTVNTIHAILGFYENWIKPRWLRNKACDEVMEQIHAEDRNTKYIDIGPVNKTLNMLCVFYASGPDSAEFKSHAERISDYLWLGLDGMKMQGYNGSQLWDTAFSVQAIHFSKSSVSGKYNEILQNAYNYLNTTQVIEEVPTPNRHYRHVSVGAWPFSTRDHGWPISDCTAEGLKAVLYLNNSKDFQPKNRISDERLYDAVNVILSLQNSGGGWATYEQQRTTGLIELLNPSETFHGIMVDYPYVECSSACVQALVKFANFYPNHRTREIQKSIKEGIKYIKSIQRKDGSWKGSWGVCFTYAIWFGIEALATIGEFATNSESARKACEFLLTKQNGDGGWGESFNSCVTMEYVQHKDGSQVVNTAWAVIALLIAKYPDRKYIQRGVEYLVSKQLPNGDWEQEGISGVFNANCAISYSGYKNIFPIWAIGLYESLLNEAN